MSFIAHFAQINQSTALFDNPTPAETTTAIVFLLGMGLFIFIVMVLAYVISSLILSRIFKKAGVEQWIAWVPFYNSWKILELGDQQGFWAVLAIIPVVNIVAAVFMYIAMYNIGLKFGKKGWFVLLAIFIPIVWLAWLAFDRSKWNNNLNLTPPAGSPPPVS